MSDTGLMVIDNAALSVYVTPKAEEMKLEALLESALVGKVENAAQQEVAVAAQTALDDLIRLTEKERKRIKAPVIELGKSIDGRAATFIQSVVDERSRVTMLIANFQQLELAKVRAAEAAAKLEAERIEKERLDELRRLEREQALSKMKAQEAEREAFKVAQKASNARQLEESHQVLRELERQRELAEASNLEQMQAVQERFNAQSAVIAAKPIPVPAKAEGQMVKPDWDIVVTDPYKLAKYHPQCVNITAKVGEIKQLLAQGITVNGVTATPIIKVGTRPVTQQKAIEV